MVSLTQVEPGCPILSKILPDGSDRLPDGHQGADAHEHGRLAGGLRTENAGGLPFAVVERSAEVLRNVVAGRGLVFLNKSRAYLKRPCIKVY